MKRIALAMAMVLLATPLGAQERIRSYDVEVDVRADGSLDVKERITVHAEGQQIRRGIYRDFPTRYKDRYGNRVRVDLKVNGVERNGNPEPWFTERMSNGVRINTGNDDFLPVPADYTYTLRYRTTRQLGFFEDHNELYWNAIGTGWIFPIESATVRVRLPGSVPIDQMKAEGYTGPQGAKGSNYLAELTGPGVASYRLTQPLGPNEGFTVVLAFPKMFVAQPLAGSTASPATGSTVPKVLVAEPTRGDRVLWFFADNRGVLIALIGLIVLVWFCVREWRRVGRDPEKRAIFARYEPPDDKTAAGLRYVERMGYDTRCFSAEVLALAVGGHLRINREKRFLKDDWRLDRNGAASLPVSPSQNALLKLLFPHGKQSLELKNTNAAIVSSAQDAHKKELEREFHPRYFQRNRRSLGFAIGIAVLAAVVAFVGSGGYGIPAIVFIVVAMVITLIVFGRLVRAPTKEGRALMDEIEGLKLYLSVAERDELASVRGPDEPPMLDAERYEALLPYAVALEVEDAWTEKFTAAAGAAAAAEAASRMSWYSGRGPITNLGDFSRSMGSSLSSQISSASSPPGSSSGSGGGGSSGGGGGGGGGGGR
jgi:uncharacterized membrane protein YgcG